jgi:hypothetical protein
MGTFVWRARRSAADIRLKNWYNHRRAEIVGDSRPWLVRAALRSGKELRFALLPLLRRARLPGR